jgi:hypothetical protein
MASINVIYGYSLIKCKWGSQKILIGACMSMALAAINTIKKLSKEAKFEENHTFWYFTVII